MKSDKNWFDQLTQVLPEASLPWVFAALKQEPFVWYSLQDPAFLTRAVEFIGNETRDWSPGMLALLSLDLPARSQWYKKEPLTALDNDLRQQVARTFESLTKGEVVYEFKNPEELQQPSWFSGMALPKAGLLALALRERLRLLNSWSGLREDLEGLQDFHYLIWKAPLACLFGILSDPVGLLLELTSPGATYEMQNLAIHCVLANPFPPDESKHILQTVLENTEPSIQHSLLSILLHKKPVLGREMAEWLVDQPLIFPGLLLNNPKNDLIENVLNLSHQAELQRSAMHYGQSLRLIEQVMQLISRLRVDYSARWAEIAAKSLEAGDGNSTLTHADVVSAWKQVNELDQTNPDGEHPSIYQTEVSRTLILAGELGEIQKWLSRLDPESETDPAAMVPLEIKLALTRYLVGAKNFKQAQDITDQLISWLQTSDKNDEEANLWLKDFYGCGEEARISLLKALTPTLLELGQYQQCIWAAQEILVEQPEDVPSLQQLSAAYRFTDRAQESAFALQLAVILEPRNIQVRRDYASCLEALGEYPAAMEHWSYCVENNHSEDEDQSKLRNDSLALACCAIAAGKAETASEICQQILKEDVSNWRAHTLLGKSLSIIETPQAGLANLHIASQLAPDQSEPWLEMACIYQQTGQAQEAILALQAAAQAAPQSASIHLELGKVLLNDNALTSAAESLKLAYILAQPTQEKPVSTSSQTLFLQAAMYLGQALRRLGHLSDSRQILEPAIQVVYANTKISHPDLLYTYAQTLLALGDTSAALPVLARVVSTDPNENQPYIDYAKTILQEESDFSEAVRVLKHVQSIDPGNTEALAYLAEALAGSHLFSEAKQVYQEVLETPMAQEKSWQERIYYGFGRTALALNEVETAHAALQEAAQANPRSPGIQRNLADACWAAHLDFDAWEAAKSALQLDPSNPNVIAWFTDHTIALYGDDWDASKNHKQPLELQAGQPGVAIHPQDVLTEALNAFNTIYPSISNQAEMVLRLGQLFTLNGQTNGAKEKLRQVSQCPDASSEGLQLSGRWLYKLNDLNGAIHAFDCAMRLCQQQGDRQVPGLAKDLAQAYLKDGQLLAAKQILQQAVKTSDEDADLYLTLALVTHTGGQTDNALEIVTVGLEKCLVASDQTALHYLAARLLQFRGFIGQALNHAESALALSEPLEDAFERINLYEVRSLAAQLARALLDPQRAQAYLNSLPALTDVGASNDLSLDHLALKSAFECYCAAAELALDADDTTLAAASLANAQTLCHSDHFNDYCMQKPEFKDVHPRIAAIQARLLHNQGDLAEAQQVFSGCSQLSEEIKHLGEDLNSPIQVQPVWEQAMQATLDSEKPALSPYDYLGVACAALDLEQWDLAVSLAHALMTALPAEPLYTLTYLRCIIQQAEIINVCRDLSIVRHAPIQSKPLDALRAIFHGCVDQAEKAFWVASQAASPEAGALAKIENMPGNAAIQRWRCRGLWALYADVPFEKQPFEIVNGQGSNAFIATHADIASHLAAVRRWIGNRFDEPELKQALHKELSAAEAFQSDPGVLVQQALLLEAIHPEEALLTATNLVRLAEESGSILLQAQAQGLLAIVAFHLKEQAIGLKAIQAALAIWPEEPRWQAMASQICLSQDLPIQPEEAVQAALDHLEEAIRLEPDFAQHYAELSKLLAFITRRGPDYLKRIIRSLEKAVHYAPDQPAAWISLAKAYLQSNTSGNLDQAVVCLDKVVELVPTFTGDRYKQEAMLMRAEIYLLQKEPQGALNLGTLLLRENPGDNRALMVHISALEALNRQSDALKVLETTELADSLPKELRIKQAALMGQCLDRKLEIAALTDLAKENPADLDILMALTKALMAAGQIDMAIQAAQTALQTGPSTQNIEKYARMHHLLGNLLSQIGQLDQGIHHLSQAIQYLPDFVEAYLDLGSAYQKQRQHLKAQKIYQQAIQAVQYDARPYVQAATCLKEGKDYQGAENLLRRAVELAPNDVSIRKQLAAIVAINLVHNPHPVQTY